MDTQAIRHAGVLLHPTSLHTTYGIGDIGPASHDWIDDLAKHHIDMWQMLPLGPTGYGNSPYASRSAFAGNELLVSPDMLQRDGWLEKEELEKHPQFPDGFVDYEQVIDWKIALLKKAALRFLTEETEREMFDGFCEQNKNWLDDYALFMVLYEKYRDARWFSQWEEPYAKRDKVAMASYEEAHHTEIEVWKALQFFWQQQWDALKEHAHSLGISLIGDVPIFVASDSADTWSHIDLFQTGKDGRFSNVSGVPPDNFCATGQLWGNPVYDWDAMRETEYAWWIERLRRLSTMTDYLRIDHFRGFEAYWSVPAQNKTAELGTWVKVPGKEFFSVVRKNLPDLKIIAEDLGFITPDVEKLKDDNGFPGMRIAEFGFNLTEDGKFDAKDTFLPHNYERNVVAYTGTHDNETFRGWFDHQGEKLQNTVLSYLDATKDDVVEKLIRSILMSNADYAIIPLQDIMGLGNEARMNTPATCGRENWSWRLKENDTYEKGLNLFGKEVFLSGRSQEKEAQTK
jgi:4-alpha-glucanotransferase